MCADALAHIGCDLKSFVMFYESCPTQIKYLLIADAAGACSQTNYYVILSLSFGPPLFPIKKKRRKI
jgi:hypothetical protein